VNRENASLPLYEYECKKCGRRHERIENFKGPHLKKCPTCGGKVEQLISAPALQFKGSGWYVTDYARKSGPSREKKTEKEGSKQAVEGKAAKEPAPSQEKKPAKKD